LLKGDRIKAIKFYETFLAIASNTEKKLAYHRLASCYFVNGQLDNADIFFKKAIEAEPNSGAFCAYGHFLFQQGRYREAIIQIKKSIKYLTDDRQLFYDAIAESVMDIHLSGVVNRIGTISLSASFTAYYFLVKCYHELNNLRGEESWLRKLSKIVLKNNNPVELLLLFHLYQMKTAGYMENIESMVKIASKQWTLWILNAKRYCVQPQLSLVVDTKEIGGGNMVSEAMLLLAAANQQFLKEDRIEAIKFYEEFLAIASNTEKKLAYHRLASCYFVNGQLNNADIFFKKAIEAEPNSGAFCAYGHFLFQQGHYREAIIQLRKSIKYLTDDRQPFYEAATECVMDIHLSRVVDRIDTKSLSTRFRACYFLVKCYHELNNLRGEESWLRELSKIVLKNNNPVALLLLFPLYQLKAASCANHGKQSKGKYSGMDVPRFFVERKSSAVRSRGVGDRDDHGPLEQSIFPPKGKN